MDQLYFGVDIGGTATKIGAFDQRGALLSKWEIKTDISENGSLILPHVAEEILHYARNLSRVIAIGVGIPGPVQRGGYVKRCVNLGWGDFNPARELASILRGVPVFAGNDANMAAMGEYWQGSGRDAENLVFITLGTGVGGGIILDGRMVYGMGGLGGEIGHVVVNPEETIPCNCGQYGCLDQTASATGIVRAAQRLLQESGAPSTLRALENITARDVVDAARHGDELAEKAFESCMYFLGKSMAMLTNIIDPEVFIIGGGVSKAGDYLVDTVKKHYEAMATLSENKAAIVLAKLGNDAGIYGAAKLAMDCAH
ncbi:MAG: ROK family glucokinase [Clostridiales bacterium]|nr:ROK family glucokinase [Clostridiales bacterium]